MSIYRDGRKVNEEGYLLPANISGYATDLDISSMVTAVQISSMVTTVQISGVIAGSYVSGDTPYFTNIDGASSGQAIRYTGVALGGYVPPTGGGGGGAAAWTDAGSVTMESSGGFLVTDDASSQAILTPGRALKLTTGYGVALSYTSGHIEYAGYPSISSTAVEWGLLPTQGRIYSINGAFADGSNAALLATDLLVKDIWNAGPARCVRFEHYALTGDTGTQPNVNAIINGLNFSTTNADMGRAVTSGVWVGTVVDCSAQAIAYGQAIELRTSAGQSGDAKDLTALITFVMEN